MDVSSETISTKQLINEYESYSDMAILFVSEDCVYALTLGPLLILSIIALQRLRKLWSSVPLYSVKWLYMIILTQMILAILRFACRIVTKVFDLKTDIRYFVTDDGSIHRFTDNSFANAKRGLAGVAMLSARVMEVLASAVLIWRACAISLDLFWVRSLLIFAWMIDSAMEGFYFGAYVSDMLLFKDITLQLRFIALSSSRWTSFALNLLATLLIAYRARTFKNVLADSGLAPGKSAIYHILARLVETGVLLLVVQLIVAILATTKYKSFNLADPGFVAMNDMAEFSLIVITAHPAAITLLVADILSKRGGGSGDTESAGASTHLVFRVTETQLSTAVPKSHVSSVHTEK
ncbi:hypothetical protein DL96DRAFT_1821503 [Flagelloscypha sp. PMI_526]|nr:hypothetical protein DL96DRAFT_1821503 [Flagelloscypha sp. PMI_526]